MMARSSLGLLLLAGLALGGAPAIFAACGSSGSKTNPAGATSASGSGGASSSGTGSSASFDDGGALIRPKSSSGIS